MTTAIRNTIFGLALVAAVAPAHADDKARAKALYQTGLDHYNLSEWADAIKAWKESYRLSKRPLLLFNIGQAYRLSGDCKMANTFYESYQREEPNPKNQGELDQAIALCAKAADKPATDQPSVSDKPAGDKPAGDKPAADKPPVGDKASAGDKTIGDKPGTPSGKPGDATSDKAGDSVAATGPDAAPSEPEEPVDAPTSTGGGLRKVGIGVGVAGVVAAGVGVYFALDSSSASNELDGYAGEWGQEQVDIEARGERSAQLAWILGGAGAGAVALGVVLYAVGGPKAVESNTVSIVPTRGGAQLGWAFRF